MGLREIKAALRQLAAEGGEKAAGLLILTVPYKRGKAPAERADMIKAVARIRGGYESPAEVTQEVKGWVPGVLIRAKDHDQVEGELILLSPGGEDWAYAGGEVNPSPDDLRWSDAQIMDDEAELFPLDRWEEAVAGILYGARLSKGKMYFRGLQD